MKVEKLENEEKLTDTQINNLFNSIVQGKDVTEVINTSKGEFKIKFPRAKDIESIGRLTAYRLNGIAAKCFDDNTYMLMHQIATLDILVLSGPAWYELAKKENMNFSWQEIPSQKFINEVYSKVFSFRTKIQEQIESDPLSTDKIVATSENSIETSQYGLCDGVSN